MLRDVQVFRLREDGDPDRELLPTAAGPVHVTGSYPLDAFSDEEWQSEERQRYVDELTRDVVHASDQVGDTP